MLQPTPAPKLSAAQLALLAVQKHQARSLFVSVNLLLLLFVLYTSHRFPHKYLRVVGECDSNWLRSDATEANANFVCCDGVSGHGTPPCYPGMGLMAAAWAIPLSALIFNYGAMMLGPDATMPRVRIYVRRGLLYVGVMALRTVVLYMGLGAVEKRMVHVVMGHADHSCWFAELRRGKRCPADFDHSDHVVLLVSHYVAIPLFEWFALAVESPSSSVKQTLLRAWLLVVGALATYLLFFTASFFHTTAENLVGLVIAQLFVMTPLLLLTQDYFGSVKWLRLQNFVLPPAAALSELCFPSSNLRKIMSVAVKGIVRLRVLAGKASPSPAIGQALGPLGVNMMEFCKAFNERTSPTVENTPVPVVLTAFTDRTFSFTTKTPPASWFLKKAAGITSGSATPGQAVAGSVSLRQIYEIAKVKQQDEKVDYIDLQSICKSLIGSAKSMGLNVVP
ncbi:hypothetical protein BBJ28_00009802 [Nothophytophthora sp. Chile5]|nr:hypothetical protein BBJ28_00009802 [Nothophytophthora sp. Chile5]